MLPRKDHNRRLLDHSPPPGVQLPPYYGRSARHVQEARGSVWIEKSAVQEIGEALGVLPPEQQVDEDDEEETKWANIPTFDDDVVDLDPETHWPIRKGKKAAGGGGDSSSGKKPSITRRKDRALKRRKRKGGKEE